jgi:hypothetical protein
MSDSIDLRGLLKSWAYDPDQEARLVRGDDGREIMQVRTPLGVEQYELDGRPDGERPHGMESALEFHLQRLEKAKTAGQDADFDLSPRECAELFNEGTLYYFRYVRLFQLKQWPRTIRDTDRNLRLFDLAHRYARREEDQQYLEKWRPYIMRINASASAIMEWEQRRFEQALSIVEQTRQKIEALPEVEDETFQFERDRSLTALRELGEQIQKDRPVSELEKLERQLRRAVQSQEFERAAGLRDRIRQLKSEPEA